MVSSSDPCVSYFRISYPIFLLLRVRMLLPESRSKSTSVLSLISHSVSGVCAIAGPGARRMISHRIRGALMGMD
jgi:hypothetical protein